MIQVKTLVIGLGNPILGDDGVGWRVAENIRNQAGPVTDVDVDCLSLGGISLMEHLIGYEYAILVDAFEADEPPGSIMVTKLDELPDRSALHITSVHDTSLQNAMKLGRQIGAKLPDTVTVVGIAVKPVYDFSEALSPPVEDAVPRATQIVFHLLRQNIIIH